MKKINNYLALIALLSVTSIANAQTNILPSTGNVGIGTLSPTANLQVVGKTILGSKKNSAIFSAQGNLSFKGTAVYQVDSNQYVFQNSVNPNYGLYFGQSVLRYEFRDINGAATFFVGADNGNGYFAGNLGVGILNPASKLDVNGDINISSGSALKINGKNVFKTNGNGNVFIGEDIGLAVTTGNDNTITGYRAFYSNTTGVWNTANGYMTLYNNTTGNANIANGYLALYSNTTGESNIANGIDALYSNTTGSQNEATGYQSLYYNKTGSANAAYGLFALNSNTVGNFNTATGNYALTSNKTGEGNVASGYRALYYNNSGNYNTGIGAESFINNMAGSYNTALGAYTSIYNNGLSNSTVIGYNAYSSASNQVRIGNSSVTSIGGYANWTNISDGRVKKNIKENVPGLDFINKLKPVTYNLDLNQADKILQRPVIKDSTGNIAKPSQEEMVSRDAKMQVLYTGFIAQDVEKVAKSLNYNFSGVDMPKNDKDLYGLRYAEFVVPLVKAVQELSKENDELKNDLNDLKNLVLSMQQQSSTNGFAQPVTKTIAISSASLEQNAPNPFSNVTTIGYNLPVQVSSAKIIVTDKTGKTIKEISLKGSGKGTIQLDASTLSSGAYQYALYVNNKLIDSKQMILAK